VGAALATQFGALPVIGIGHSCGALLQTLITSEFPEASRSTNVLISFNNKPVKEAIPGFDQIVPVAEQVMGPSDGAVSTRDALAAVRNVFDGALEGFSASEVAPAIVKDELLPAVKQSLEVVDQIPDILASIASGTKEFAPSPEETRALVASKYRARRTFIVRFENDAIDESPEIDGVLRDAVQQSNGTMEVAYKEIVGTHVTPLTQNVFVDPPWPTFGGQFGDMVGQTLPDPLSPLRQEVRENFLQTVNEVKTSIADWLQRQ
jgi:hypothetical protein